MTFARSPRSRTIQKSLLTAAVFSAVALMGVSHSSAAILTWDAGGGGGAATDGGGAWTGAGLWNNAGAAATWNNATPDTAVIGSGGAGGTITLTGGITTTGITFNSFTGTYTLGSGALTVGTGGINLTSAAGTVLFGSSMGTITLSGAQTWTNNSASTFTFGSAGTAASLVNGGNTLTFDGSGQIIQATTSYVISGAGGLIKNGSGTTTLGSYNSFTGAVSVNAGTLAVSGGASGASSTAGGGIASASSITVNPGATLSLLSNGGTGTAGTGVNRINDTRTVTLNGARFSLTSAGSIRTFEQIGTLALGNGANTVTVDTTSTGIAALSATDLSRAFGSTILFRGNTALGSTTTGANAPHIQFTVTTPLAQQVGAVVAAGNAGNTTIQILPYAIADATSTGLGTDFVTYDTSALAGGNNNASVRGIRPLASNEYATTISDGVSSTNNVKLGATNAALGSATAINSLVLNNATSQVSGAGSLTVTSGAILSAIANNGITVNTLAFGSREAIIHSVAALNISSNITGSGGITKSSPGTLTLSGTSSNTGKTTVNQGNLTINNPGSLANSNIDIRSGATLNGSGTLNYQLVGDAADLITVQGTFDITSLHFNLVKSGTQNFSEYVIANYTGGTLTGASFASATGITGYTIDYDGTLSNPGNKIVLVASGGTPNFIFTDTSAVTLNVLKGSSGITASKTIQNNGTATGTASLNNTNGNLSVSGNLVNIAAAGSEGQTLSATSTTGYSTTAGTLTVTPNSGGSNVVSTTVNVGNATADRNNSRASFTGTILTAAVGTNASYAGLASKVTAETGSGGLANLGTEAIIQQGKNATGLAETVSMTWRTRTTGEDYPSQIGDPFTSLNQGLVSDIVRLTGMGNGGAALPNGTIQTDPFALQMSYSQTAVNLTGWSENSLALGWLNNVDTTYNNGNDVWLPATDGNFGADGINAVFNYTNDFDGAGGNNAGSWANFVAQYGVNDSNLGLFLGSYGVDTTGNVVWAVLDHNSDFAVIPEPASLGLFALGGLSLLTRRRRSN